MAYFTEDMKPIHKFNGGVGATLCNNCSVIITEKLTNDLYCKDCINIKNLFLDDYRVPIDCAQYMYRKGVDCRIYHRDWVIVRSYIDFVEYITANGLPDLISFDHDLADDFTQRENLDINKWFNVLENREDTGMDAAKWLIDYCMNNNLKLPQYVVHSSNPSGYENIKGLLDNFKQKQ